MTSDMTLSGSFLDSRQMQQEVLMWLLHNAGMDVTPRNCIRVSTRQNITEEFSREKGGEGEICVGQTGYEAPLGLRSQSVCRRSDYASW